jgi:lysozyme
MAPDLITLVKVCEGFAKQVKLNGGISAVPYICPAGYWTIGYGHLCDKGAAAITEPQAALLLEQDLAVARMQTRKLLTRQLKPAQLDAITSWVFNLGSGRFRGSTLRSVINRGELGVVPGELRRWVYGGGVKLPGLVKRRELEVQLFLSA